jgi:uncharacterized protein (DUF433 family)
MRGRAHLEGSRLTVEEMVRMYHAGIPLEYIATQSGSHIAVTDVEDAIESHTRTNDSGSYTIAAD